MKKACNRSIRLLLRSASYSSVGLAFLFLDCELAPGAVGGFPIAELLIAPLVAAPSALPVRSSNADEVDAPGTADAVDTVDTAAVVFVVFVVVAAIAACVAAAAAARLASFVFAFCMSTMRRRCASPKP